MATLVTGTPTTRTEHSRYVAPVGLMMSMLPPVILIFGGVAVEGFGAISWAGAIVWGLAATVVFTGFSIMGKAVGMTRMDLLDLLGSVAAPAGTTKARVLDAGREPHGPRGVGGRPRVALRDLASIDTPSGRGAEC